MALLYLMLDDVHNVKKICSFFHRNICYYFLIPEISVNCFNKLLLHESVALVNNQSGTLLLLLKYKHETAETKLQSFWSSLYLQIMDNISRLFKIQII